MKKYLTPEMEIEVLLTEDVMTVSYDKTNLDYNNDNVGDDIF